MSLSSIDVGMEDDQNVAHLQEIDISAQDAKSLFPELGLMTSNDFDFKHEKGGVNDMLDFDQLNNDDADHRSGETIEGSEAQDISAVVATDIHAPPISQSNPETPNEPFDFSFEEFAPLMVRNSSEQSLLPSLTSKYQNTQTQVRSMSQRFDQPVTSAKPNHAGNRDKSQDRGPTTPYTPATSTISWGQNHHQAGPDMGAPFELGARQSHIRTPIRPSGLRNSYPALSPDIAQSPSRVNQSRHQQIRANMETLALDHLTEFRGRRHTDADMGSHQPRMIENNIYNSGHYAAQSVATSTNHLADQSRYPSPHPQYSQPYGSLTPYIPSLIHGNIAHGNTNSNWRGNELLLQQPTSTFPHHMLPSQTSAYLQQSLSMMKREEPSPDRETLSVNYRSLNTAEIAMDTQTRIHDQDIEAPRNDVEDKPYFDTIMASMFDISQAEDNEGMVLTWRNQLNDRDAIAEVAANLLRLCKRREELGRPFRKGGKPAHQFDNFRDRFDALCQALRTQKTMCKHLMRQPYIEEIIDDPQGAVGRIANNRKVNKGKKAAIEEGRLAMNRKAHGKSQRTTRASIGDDDDEHDAEHDSDHEDFDHDFITPNAGQVMPRSHDKGSRTHRTSSEDIYDREVSAPKRIKRASRSKYQLNENNEMIDTSVTTLKPEPRLGHAGMRNTPYQQSYSGMGGAGDHRSTDNSWGLNTNAGSSNFPSNAAYPSSNQHQQGPLRPRRNSRR